MSPLLVRMTTRGTRWAAMLLCSFLAGAMPATAAVDVGPPPDADPVAYQQIDRRESVAAHFTEVSTVSLAMAAVPDPRVPRHRRAYDLSIVALIQGMLDAGYVLDRYAFPWEGTLKEGTSKKSDGEAAPSAHRTDDCQYGLMIFRHDAWRNARNKGRNAAPALRALYLVPETNTYGLPRGTMFSAMRDMNMQLSGQETRIPAGWCPQATSASANTGTSVSPESGSAAAMDETSFAPAAVPLQNGHSHLASHGNCSVERRGKDGPSLLFLGPNFSGSLDSLAQVGREAARRKLPRICAVSASATATSNARIVAFPQERDQALEFHSLAIDDEGKLAELWELARRINADAPGKIAILSESSVFGHEVCPSDGTGANDGAASIEGNAYKRRLLCASAIHISFPANIADVRAGLRAQKLAAQRDLQSLVPVQRGLSLEDGSGSGSELPHSLQSKLTAAGTELELRKAIRMLSMVKPRLIIVVATDIRDRLFLLDMVREGVPYAQLADLELDQLMGHPEYIHATRGAVLVGSDRTTSGFVANPARREEVNSYAFSSTDYQVLLRRVARGIDSNTVGARSGCSFSDDQRVVSVGEGQPILHVVGRQRIVALDCLSRRGQISTSWLTPLLGLLAIGLLINASPAMHSLFGRAPKARGPLLAVHGGLRKWLQIDDPSLNHSVIGLLAGLGLLLISGYMGGGKSTFVVTLIAAPPLCWALAYQAGMYRRNSLKLRSLGLADFLGARIRRHVLAVLALALLLSLAGWWILQELRADRLVIMTIARFAYRADQGLAIGTAMTVAILGLVFADNTLAVARGASDRNRYVAHEGFWSRADQPKIDCHLRAMFSVGVFPRSPIMAIGLMALVLCLTMALPLKRTLFGEFLAVLALIAVASLNLVALAFFANAVRLRRRALYLSGIVQSLARRPSDPSNPKNGEGSALGLWPAAEAVHVRFAATPAAARIKDAGEKTMTLLGPLHWVQFAQDLSALRKSTDCVPEPTRAALYVLFASEVSQTRWATFGSAACCLAVAAFVYLYPVSGANAFVLFALGLLMLNGMFAGFTAMSFERNEAMSNILCNRTAKVEFSGTLFNYIAFPFVVLAVCLAIVQVPGVLDWSEGLFKSLLNIARGRTLESVL